MSTRINMPGHGRSDDYFGLIVCGALFICGSIAGTVSAGYSAGGSGLSDYLTGLLALADGDSPQQTSFLLALLNASKYHLAAIFFGFSVLGVLFVPALSAVRGFFLCFSVSAIVRHFGPAGVLPALAVFGLSSLLTIPCFFVLSIGSLRASFFLLRSAMLTGPRGFSPYGGTFFRRLCICAAVLAVSALLDCTVVPGLAAHAARLVT